MKHAIIFCVEKGLLEQQAILLVSSYLKYAQNKNIQLFAFSPRQDFQPDKITINFLKKNNVIHNSEPLNIDFLDYPIANKILCCEYFERNYRNYNSVIFLDTDTAFLNNFKFDDFINSGLYLKPVGHKGPGSSGTDDENDEFWLSIFKLFDLPLPPVSFKTTIKNIPIRGYFNAGLIWSVNLPDFFKQWKIDFLTILESDIRPPGFVSKDGNDFRCLDQVALAVTASRYENELNILPTGYNFHIPFKPIIVSENNPEFKDLVHIHYHKWFQHPGFLDYVTSDEDKQTEQYRWLKEQLPLQPTIDGPFKC